MQTAKFSWKLILLTALLVGTLDIAAALINYYISSGRNPFSPVLKFIASGVFGREAFSLGDRMIWLGLFFHYCIATLFTIFFFIVYRLFSLQSVHWILTGIVYGLFVWAAMRFIIIPASQTPAIKSVLKQQVIAALILITMIGLPLSYIAWRRRSFKRI